MKKLKQLVPEGNLTISRSTRAEREYTKPILPVDLLIDIFSRVPFKSVARFRCLSKSWASILVRPYFTELFLTKSSNRPRLLFTVSVDRKLFFFSTPQTLNSSVVATCYKTLSSPHEVTSSLLHGGLVCCKDWTSKFSGPVICNPATGELLTTLPEPISCFYNRVLFCGYDPTEKKFKLLSLAAYSNINQACVLILEETGKLLWRMIDCEYHYVMFSQGHMICIDGVLYYLGCVDFGVTVIVCFDVKSEKFSFINIDLCGASMSTGFTFINYMGRLGVVQFTDYEERTLRLSLLEDDADVMINKWSINIYELPLSWKHPCTESFRIVGMTRTCDIVLSPRKFSDPFYVFYFNVEKKTLARSEIQGLQKLKSHRPPVYIFQDYIEDLKLMKSFYN